MTNDLKMTWAVLNDPIRGPRLAASWVTDKSPAARQPARERAPIILIARDEAPSPTAFGTYAFPEPIDLGTYAFSEPDEPSAA